MGALCLLGRAGCPDRRAGGGRWEKGRWACRIRGLAPSIPGRGSLFRLRRMGEFPGSARGIGARGLRVVWRSAYLLHTAISAPDRKGEFPMTSRTATRTTAPVTTAATGATEIIVSALPPFSQPVTVADLAELTGFAKGTIGKLLPQLAAAGTAYRHEQSTALRAALWSAPKARTRTAKAGDRKSPAAARSPRPAAVTAPAPEPPTRGRRRATSTDATPTAPASNGKTTGRGKAAGRGNGEADTPAPQVAAVPRGRRQATGTDATPTAPASNGKTTGRGRTARKAAGESSAPMVVVPAGRLRPGQLQGIVLERLMTAPGVSVTPYHLGRELGRSCGACYKALIALAETGDITQTSTRPQAYAYLAQ